MSRIDEIRARLAGATPGPWRHVSDDRGELVGVNFRGVSEMFNSHINCEWPTDARFVVNAPDDIAWLLAERDALAAKLATEGACQRTS